MGAILITVRLMAPRLAALLLMLAVGMAPISGALCEVLCASTADHAGAHSATAPASDHHDAVSESAAHAAHMAHAEQHHDAVGLTVATPASSGLRNLVRAACCQAGTASRTVATTARSSDEPVAAPAASLRLAGPAPAMAFRFPGPLIRPPLGRPPAPVVLRV